LVAGCSTGGSSSANASLQGDVRALTQAAAAQDWTAADAAMSALRADLAAALAAGTISPARASVIRSHLATVAADLAARTSTPAPSPTTATPGTPKPKPKPKPKPPGDGHGRHHGNNNDGGDGGD
jgi:hypothetical protein